MTFLEDYIAEKMKGYTLVMLVQGYPQYGKSTLVYYLMNALSWKINNEAWDYKKYCARSIKEFSHMIKYYDGKLLVYEEASKDVSIDRLWDEVNHAFNLILQTQQYKKNLVCLVFPFSMAVSNRQRYFIKLGIEVKEKINEPDCKAVIFNPTIYKRTFWKLDDNDINFVFPPSCFVKYREEDLKEASIYTDWLIEKKKEIMEKVDNDILISERKEKIKCAVCGRKIHIRNIEGIYVCNLHYDFINPNINHNNNSVRKIQENNNSVY